MSYRLFQSKQTRTLGKERVYCKFLFILGSRTSLFLWSRQDIHLLWMLHCLLKGWFMGPLRQ